MFVSTSFSLPQSVPARHFRTLFLACILVFKFNVCCLNDSRLSKVMPRNLGFWTVGTVSSLILTSRVLPTSFEDVVNRVAEDLEGEMNKFRPLNQESKVERYVFSSSTTVSMMGPELRILESSAYDTSLIFPGGEGIVDI